ncbi:hypothetical protein PHLCEN_2v3437 [Hermanssonia centrifuga]|uniref:Uncharacterized protein n=1 Tax=Hermanssonia centrifuga TaxID=98765 RepID=A0A2R6QIP6_9APHY|nr:hypothetical protein PHLCEN_2v3437 [Hermanssonia centrifuga]
MGKKHRKETRSSRFSTPTTITGNSGFIYCSSSSKKSSFRDDAFDIISPKPSPPPSVFAPLPDYHPPSLRPFVPPESTISGTRMSTPGSLRSSAVTTISISSTGSTTPSPPLPSPKLPPKADPQERHSLFYFTDDLVTFTVSIKHHVILISLFHN